MVPELTRRRVIATGALGALSVASGCSALSGSDATELGQIAIENGDDVDHAIHVAVERDSELVYGASRELEGTTSSNGIVNGAVLTDTEWANETGSWVVHTRVDDGESWTRHEVPTDGTCHAVRLKIEADGSVTSFFPDCESWPPSETE